MDLVNTIFSGGGMSEEQLYRQQQRGQFATHSLWNKQETDRLEARIVALEKRLDKLED